MRISFRFALQLAIAAVLAPAGCARGGEAPRLVLGTTHTLEDSGLLRALEIEFQHALGADYRLSTVVAGSGEVLALARRGDVDVVLSHSPEDEAALVSAGRAESRLPVMHNDFVLIGPPGDPAGVRGASSAREAMLRLTRTAARFISRGDDSGTHRKEMALWAAAGAVPDWPEYLRAGAGMADALRVASQRSAYVLSDRATWETLRRELQLELVLEDATALQNPYSVLVVSSAANLSGARRFAEWIRSPEVQRFIAGYGIDSEGRPLFLPDAAGPDREDD